jgi:hypothetical protein
LQHLLGFFFFLGLVVIGSLLFFITLLVGRSLCLIGGPLLLIESLPLLAQELANLA